MPCLIDVASRRISSQWARMCLTLTLPPIRPASVGYALGVAVDVEALVGQVADARREAEAQQVHQGEHMVGEAGRVGVVLLDPQVGLVVEQAVRARRSHRAPSALMTLVWNGAYWSEMWV